MPAKMAEIDEITRFAIAESTSIHRDLDLGLLESVYEAILCKSLLHRGLIR